MDARIRATCSAECVRAFLAYGTSRSVGQISMRGAIAGVMVAGQVDIYSDVPVPAEMAEVAPCSAPRTAAQLIHAQRPEAKAIRLEGKGWAMPELWMA
jgi:hypothetical protein